MINRLTIKPPGTPPRPRILAWMLVTGIVLAAGTGYVAHRGLHDPQSKFAILDELALKNSVELFAFENGRLPGTLDELVPQYVKELHADPWGSNYLFQRNASGFVIASLGSEHRWGGRDFTSLSGFLPQPSTARNERHSP